MRVEPSGYQTFDSLRSGDSFPTMASYLYSQPKEKLSGYFIQIGIDDFGIINNVQGQIYGNYILKRVAECIAECLSSGQRIYHLVTDKYMLVDMLSKSQDDVVQLFKCIC